MVGYVLSELARSGESFRCISWTMGHDNKKVFDDLIDSGVSLGIAASATPLGKIVAMFGYRNFKVQGNEVFVSKVS